MSNTLFRQAGEQLDFTPAAAVAAGALIQRGLTVGHVARPIAAGIQDALQVDGVVRVPKASATVFSVAGAAPVYWNSGTGLAVGTQNAMFLGSAVGGGASGDLFVDVKINDVANDGTIDRTLRVRVTLAQVNAGLNLLPAIPGRRYRLVDVGLIAIGGAAAGATSVNIRATQAATVVSVLAAAVAGLTQNTLLRAGAANAAILAAGASFVANDVNTPISINATGTLTTATDIDVLLHYTIE